MNWDALLKSHFIHGLGLMILGLVAGWVLGYWRRRRLMKAALGGEAREILTVEKILLRDHSDGRTTLRIRSLGSEPLNHVLANPVAHDAFLTRAGSTTTAKPLLHLDDPMGSFILHLLQPWVCGMAQNGGPFKHEVWIMAPVCEPGLLSAYRSSTVVLIRQDDLKRFLDWEWCKQLWVEHGSDGARVLTLWQMAREFERQIAEVKRRRDNKESSRFVETMYILDLGLDTDEVSLATKPIRWERFAPVLKELNLP